MDGAEQQQNEGAAPASAASNGDHTIDAAERRRRWRSAWWVTRIACLMAVLILLAYLWRLTLLLEREDVVLANCDQMLLALTVFDLEHNRYPSTFESREWREVIESRNIEWPLVNPYTELPVDFVTFEQRSPGNMTYIRIPKGSYTDELLEHDTYWLIVYGEFPWRDWDIDGDGKGDQVRAILGGTSFNDASYPPHQLDTPWKAIQWAEGTEE